MQIPPLSWSGTNITQLSSQDFANGYLFGKLLHLFNLQPDIAAFLDKEKPDAFIHNYAKLQVSAGR